MMRGFNTFGRAMRMPNGGGKELNEFTSWKTISSGFSQAAEYSRRLKEEKDRIGTIYSGYRQARNNVVYGQMNAGIGGIQGRIGGRAGQAVDSSISNFFKKVAAAGGAKIGNSDLAKAIGELQKNIGRIASQIGGSQGTLLKTFAHALKGARKAASSGGLGALGKGSNDFIKTAFGFKVDNTIDSAKKDLASEIRKTAQTISSPYLRRALLTITREMHRAANAAKTSLDKKKVIEATETKLRSLRGMTTNVADRVAVDGLSKSASKKTTELTKGIIGLTKAQRGGVLNRNISKLAATVGMVGRSLGTLKRTFNIGNAVFQAVNSRFNQFARMQMRVSAERGYYGRQIRGAGINFGHMTAALGAGRSAGMDDRAVVSQMVNLQGNLARARWGEGPLIENMGKWGLTPFDANGNMKSNHEVMIDFSRKLNSMTDKMEKLQFLQMQGFSPEQMEYVSNYEKFAKRQAYLKSHPEMRGTLEQADYLDESGFSAKADAATKVELRRREVLNQNAIEKGIIPGLIRSMSPDNWFFSDWTARQQGVASAKSEQAMEKLTEELKHLSDEVRKSGGEIGAGSFSGKETNLSAKELKGLSLSGGWAESSKANFGDKSAVHILKKVIGARSSGVDSDTQKNINRGVGALIGGAIGYGLGALTTFFTGGAGAATIPLFAKGLGALGGAIGGGMAGSKVMENTKGFWDFSDDDVEEARKAAKGSTKDWENWKKKTGLTNLKKSQVLDVDFDKESLEGAKVQSLIARASEMAGGKEVNLEALAGDKYLDRMTVGVDQSSKEFEDRVVEALARTADETIGRSEAILRIIQRGVKVTDPDVAKRVDELTKINEGKGMGAAAAKSAAEEQAVQEVKDDAMKYGDLVKQKIIENKKEVDRGYQEYVKSKAEDREFKEQAVKVREQYEHAKSTRAFKSLGFMSYEQWINKQAQAGNQDVKRLYELEAKDRYNRSFDRSTGEATVKEKEMSKEEWYKKNLGSQKEQERLAYNQIYGENGPMAGQTAPWESLPDTLKNDRINQFLQKKNFGGSKFKGYSDELAGLDDDSLVAKLALENDTSEEEVRKNILSQEEYQELKGKRDRGEKINKQDTMRMRIFESSKNFQQAKKEKEKKEEETKKNEEESINDIATYREAAKIMGEEMLQTGGGGYKAQRMLATAKYGLDAKQKRRLMELQAKKDIGGLSGNGLSEEEQKEFADLERRNANMGKAKVDRKKLIKLVAAKGGDLSKNFSQEEINAYNREQEEEKNRFIQGKGHSEGEYKLFKDVERRLLAGEIVSEKEKGMYDNERKRLAKTRARKAVKPLHSEPTISKEQQAAIDDAIRNGQEATAAFEKNRRKRPLAQMSDMRQMRELEKKGMSEEELTRRFGRDRMAQYKKAVRIQQNTQWSEKELAESLRATAETFKQREGESDEDFKKRKEAYVNEGIRARKAISGKGMGKGRPENAKEPGFPTGGSASANMTKKTEGADQAASKMAANGAAAEAAAASAKEAQSGAGASSTQKNVTINLGGQTITQNIQGGIPLNPEGIKEATAQAGDEGIKKMSATLAFVAESKELI